MTISYKAIGRNIRRARLQANLTQEQLAEKIHLSALHLGRLERGERRTSLDQLGNICDTLHISMNDLLSGAFPSASYTPVHHGLGFIIQFLAAGCSEHAKGLMLDICQLIAERDKYT